MVLGGKVRLLSEFLGPGIYGTLQCSVQDVVTAQDVVYRPSDEVIDKALCL
jgi:hypothetical protein